MKRAEIILLLVFLMTILEQVYTQLMKLQGKMINSLRKLWSILVQTYVEYWQYHIFVWEKCGEFRYQLVLYLF